MPKGAKDGPKAAQFVNFDFDTATKAKFKTWRDKNRGQLADLIDRLCDSGFGISAKPDNYSGGFASFITALEPGHALAGWVLSGRGSDASNAMLGALYRHLVVFEGRWPIDSIRRAGFDDE